MAGNRQGATEKATPRRRQEARREGSIARSKEVSVAFSLLAGLLALQAVGPSAARAFREQTTMLVGTAGEHQELNFEVLQTSAFKMMATLPAFLGVLAVAGIAAGLLQVGFVVASKAATPKLKNLHPRRGLERLKPMPAMWELVRSSLKLGLLALLLVAPISQWLDTMAERKNLSSGLEHTQSQMMVILWRAVILAIVIAAADYAWNKWRTTKQQRMHKHEVKREHREQEGDPHMRAARKSKALQYSRNRMLADVGTADVVVTNPTHFAVALRYEPDSPAPKVVAKGADRLALKIRREAYRNGVLVREDKPLARELFKRCKVGHYVPAHLFEAVALLLAMAYRRNPQLWQRLAAQPAQPVLAGRSGGAA